MKLKSIILAAALLLPTAALAVDCPPGARACRVVVITPEEADTLTGPNGVFASAVWANRAAMTDLTEAWKKKINDSPAGDVKPITAPAPPVAAGDKK